jgi:hypothetical protein
MVEPISHQTFLWGPSPLIANTFTIIDNITSVDGITTVDAITEFAVKLSNAQSQVVGSTPYGG